MPSTRRCSWKVSSLQALSRQSYSSTLTPQPYSKTHFHPSGGSGGNASAKLQAETNKEIQIMQAQFQSNAQKAVDVLLSKCCEVSLEVPTARVRSTQKLYGDN